MPDIGERRIHVTASIGVASCAQAGELMATIQKQADQAMYEAKQQGRNRVSTFIATALTN